MSEACGPSRVLPLSILLSFLGANAAAAAVPAVPDHGATRVESGLRGAVFSLDRVPHEETLEEIEARKQRLREHEQAFVRRLREAAAAGALADWVDGYVPKLDPKASRQPHSIYYMVDALWLLAQMAVDYEIPQLSGIITERLRAAHGQALQIYARESEADRAIGRDGYPFDLNTVHPARTALQAAHALKILNAYDGSLRETTETFIASSIEGKTRYTGMGYQTTGYNKEVYASAISSYVLLLYPDEPARYPLCRKSFEAFWEGITKASYDADNSPHYDAATGLFLILRMAILHGREDDLRNSPHFRRILTRMARTVMSCGQTAKWGKCMDFLTDQNTRLWNDATASLAWDLKVGYRIFSDPLYLYVARKYEALRLFGDCNRWHSEVSTVWPKGINAASVRGVRLPDGEDTVHLTERITSRKHYDGLLLGRGDRDYKTVQDKLILSTGHHPRAPYLLMDLSYTQHKASHDHRIGIDNFVFEGTHVATRLGRSGQANHLNSIFIAPQHMTYPLVDCECGDVSVSARYRELMGYSPAFDYTLETRQVGKIDKDFVWGRVRYKRFQYEHVGASRDLLLMHNGILVVWDRISPSRRYSGRHNGGVVYQIWPGRTRTAEDGRWVLQAPHRAGIQGGPTHEISVLFFFADVGDGTNLGVVSDPKHPRARLNELFYAYGELEAGREQSFLSLIVPMKNPALTESFVRRVSVQRQKSSVVLTLPCEGERIRVVFDARNPPAARRLAGTALPSPAHRRQPSKLTHR